jgi:hypothetical protein
MAGKAETAHIEKNPLKTGEGYLDADADAVDFHCRFGAGLPHASIWQIN